MDSISVRVVCLFSCLKEMKKGIKISITRSVDEALIPEDFPEDPIAKMDPDSSVAILA